MYRDVGYYWLRLAVYILLTVCIGTMYFNIGNEFGAILVSIHSLCVRSPIRSYVGRVLFEFVPSPSNLSSTPRTLTLQHQFVLRLSESASSRRLCSFVEGLSGPSARSTTDMNLFLA